MRQSVPVIQASRAPAAGYPSKQRTCRNWPQVMHLPSPASPWARLAGMELANRVGMAADSRSRRKNGRKKESGQMKHGYLIDMDGVVYRGSELIPGADCFVRELRQRNIPFLFLTN